MRKTGKKQLPANAESAHAIYQALPDSVRVALQGKEILENAGLRGKVGGSGISAVGIIGSKTGRRPVNIIGKGSQLPDGYSPKDNSVIGPKGSVYSNTGKTDDYGNLPNSMKQEVIIDIRGQKVSAKEQAAIRKSIADKSNGIISISSIRFKTE